MGGEDLKLRKLIVMFMVAVLLLTIWSVPVLAQDQLQKEIKLNEAISMSLTASKSYQKAKLNVDKSKVQRDNASDRVDYTPVSGDPSYDPTNDAAWYSLLSADMSWEMSKKSQSAEEDKIVLDTCKKYWAVQQAQADLHSKELALAKAQSALKRIQTMVRLGMSPPEASTAGPELAIATAEKTLATAQMNLTSSQNQLKSACEALNKVIGLQSDERPGLADELKYEPLEVDSLDGAVARVLTNSPTVWQAEKSVELADYANNLAFAKGSYTDSDVRDIEKVQANLDAISAKDAAELLTRGYYYQVKSLEDSIPAAEKAEKQAEEALRVTKISYDLGMVTREDVQNSETNLAEAQKALLTAKANHAYYVMAFQKPWAASGS
jgi:outer membrane protein TolC